MKKMVFEKKFVASFYKLEKNIQQRVLELPAKFAEHTHAGIHLEKLTVAADPRIRTVRVDQSWRGVVADMGNEQYALLHVLPHDEAYRWVERNRLGVNPVTGIVEITDIGTATELVATLETDTKDEPVGGASEHLFEEIPDKAFRQLGVSEDLIPLVRDLRTEDALVSLATVVPKAQGDALLLLHEGYTPDEAWTQLASDYAVTDETIDTEDFGAALERPGSRESFVVTTSNEEIRELLTGDFAAWKTFLHATQRQMAEKPVFNGPAKVTGGAGTGKTVVAMHRARFLAQALVDSTEPTGRILFATYTRSLAENLEQNLKDLCTREQFKRIHVQTVDSFARQTVRSTGSQVDYIRNDRLIELANDAATLEELFDDGLDGEFLLAEWNQVVLARDVQSLVAYANTPRPGRGKPLARPLRKKVWAGIVRLTSMLKEEQRVTYPQMADLAAQANEVQGTAAFTHVIVDEAQDLHPAQWRLLRSAVPQGPNDLFIVGDGHQRIYDHRVSLSSIGIETRGRSKRLKINYRTSHEIMRWSLNMLRGMPINDLDGESETLSGYHSEFHGPPPEVRVFDRANEEVQYVADTIEAWLSKDGLAYDNVAVVARTRNALAPFEDALNARGIQTQGMKSSGRSGGVIVDTMHAAKGLEFTRLAVVSVDADLVPLKPVLDKLEPGSELHEAAELRERCLLYVACTRARDMLLVTSSGTPSIFLQR